MAALALACGGVEAPDAAEGSLATPLRVAPVQVLEMDLPGCEDLAPVADQIGDDFTVLRHPTDGSLRVVEVDGVFGCICGELDPFLGFEAAQSSGSGGSHVQAGGMGDGSGGLVSDDPIPIINEFHGAVEDDPDSP